MKESKVETKKDISFFPRGSLVMTFYGLRDISMIKEGDYVLSKNGTFHKVIKVTNSIAQLLEIKGHGHPNLMVTKGQKILASNYERIWNTEKKISERKFFKNDWVMAKNMKGMFWASPIKFPNTKAPIDLNEDLFWLIGAYLGIGFVMYNNNIYLKTNDFRFEELENKLNNLNLKFRKNRKEAFCEYYITHIVLADWLKNTFDFKFKTRNLPMWIYSLDKKCRENIFLGFMWAIGVFEDEKYRASTTDKYLAISIKLLAQSLGYSVALYVSTSKKNNKIIERWQIVAEINARSSVVIDSNRMSLVREITENKRMFNIYGLELDNSDSIIVDGIIVKS